MRSMGAVVTVTRRSERQRRRGKRESLRHRPLSEYNGVCPRCGREHRGIRGAVCVPCLMDLESERAKGESA